MPQKIAVITGPTATGKTRLGILLAQRLDGEIVSGDSMQLYRGMDIGTAKPTPDELAAAPHHLIDVAEPDEEWSVSRYVEAADAAVRDILSRGKLPDSRRRHGALHRLARARARLLRAHRGGRRLPRRARGPL